MKVFSRPSKRVPRVPARRPVPRFVSEPLESRQLLSATVTQSFPSIAGDPGATSSAIDLSTYFNDPAVGTKVRFATPLGDIDLELFDQQKPLTVENFLTYVKAGSYNSSFIHRSTQPSTGIQVIQGGGYAGVPSAAPHIPTNPPIPLEASTNGVISNTRGTIAMARTSNPNSATSEWFINVSDNTVLDPAAQPPGYAVFGRVINNTLSTVDAIAALPTFVFPKGTDPNETPLAELPLRDYTQANYDAGLPADVANEVTTPALVLPKLSYTVSTTNSALVTPIIDDGVLTLHYGTGTGAAQITVTALDDGGRSVSSTFTAGVGVLPVVVGADGAKSVTYTDADGTVTTVSLKGAGSATINFAGTGLTTANVKDRVTVSGTSVAVADASVTGGNNSTALTFAAKGGDGNATLGGVTTNAAIKSVSARNVTLTGSLSTGGAIGTLDLGAADNATITLGGSASGKAAAITLGTATDTTINSAVAVKSIRTTSFSGGGASGFTVTAPSIGSITAAGDFAENLTVAGAIKSITVGGNLTGTIAADSIGKITVRGNLNGSTITLSQAFVPRGKTIGSLAVGGTIGSSSIRTTGGIGSISADSINSSTIYAGVAPTTTTLPGSAGDFANPAAVGSVKLKSGYANSNLAASSLGRLAVGTIQLNNGGTAFGFAAGKIAAISGATGPGVSFNLKNLDTPADLSAQAQGLNLGDARIVLV